MKHLFLYFISILYFSIGLCQNQANIWYFGDHAGIQFNSGSPTSLTNGAIGFENNFNYAGINVNYSEGTSAISDSLGNLLFYSDGQKIWNQNHQIMYNGDSLMGNFSSTQSSIIVPKPNSSRYFYVFTVDDQNESQLKYGFRYSIVDICLDNGFGGVISTQKNILLLDTVAEKVAAVKHSNGIDYWIVTHKLYSDKFYAYLLTENGISDTVISQIGSIHPYAQGQLKISPNGEKLALSANQHYIPPYYLELFDFNKTTGHVFNPISLVSPYNLPVFGIEFSPDNSKLYCVYSGTNPQGMGIVQYNINAGTESNINNSMNIVYNTTSAIALRALQLGPNGKIYQVSANNPKYLLSINYPNNYGISCNVQDSAVYLNGKRGSIGLPSFISDFAYHNNDYKCFNSISEVNIYNSLKNYPNPFNKQTIIESQTFLKNACLKITNIYGITLKELNNINGEKITLERENLPSGIFYLQLFQNNRLIASTKLIITD